MIDEIKKFQSAPPTVVRGDPAYTMAKTFLGWFQSAPPTVVRGDRIRVFGSMMFVVVSIRSPHCSEGRQTPETGSLPTSRFQSAPPTVVRGDVARLRLDKLYFIVSIRSPHCSEGRRNR